MAGGGMFGGAGAFWATRALEVVKRNDSPGLLWKRIKLTTTRKNNAKKRLKRLWQSKREQRGHLDWRRNRQDYSIRIIALCAVCSRSEGCEGAVVDEAMRRVAVVVVAEVGKLMSRRRGCRCANGDEDDESGEAAVREDNTAAAPCRCSGKKSTGDVEMLRRAPLSNATTSGGVDHRQRHCGLREATQRHPKA
uniref:Uncharacterized protein n=1 Tax=Oryza meridionalis TaxID=40149 RepID=A0A0E0FC49_9ORYZ